MKPLWPAFGLAILLAMPAGAADVGTVLAVPRQRVETADFSVNGHLVRVEADGRRSSSEISIKAHWFPGVLRVLVQIGSPARSHILLEMRPNGQNSIQIVHPGDKAPVALPFSKWNDGPLGAGFTYEDFLEPQYFWPTQSVAENTKFGARTCDLLTSKPSAGDRTHYAGIRTWLDQGIGFPVYVEKTLKETGTVKEFTYFGLRHDGGVWSAHQVESKVRGQGGSTLLIIDRGSAKAKLTLKDFSPEQITRFQD